MHGDEKWMVEINPWNLSARCHLRERNQSKYLRGKMTKISHFFPSHSLSTNILASYSSPSLSMAGGKGSGASAAGGASAAAGTAATAAAAVE